MAATGHSHHQGPERLQIAEERQQAIRELHEMLGHSLTTVALKAGLAQRLLERGEVDHAAVEMSDVEQLARQVLAEVRKGISE